MWPAVISPMGFSGSLPYVCLIVFIFSMLCSKRTKTLACLLKRELLVHWLYSISLRIRRWSSVSRNSVRDTELLLFSFQAARQKVGQFPVFFSTVSLHHFNFRVLYSILVTYIYFIFIFCIYFIPLIIIIITRTMFMVLSSWQSHCESLPGRRPKTNPDDLSRLWVRLYRLQETKPTIAIYYYSARKLILILPSHRG